LWRLPAAGCADTPGPYVIVRLLPPVGSEPHYRAKSAADGRERALLEGQMRSVPAEPLAEVERASAAKPTQWCATGGWRGLLRRGSPVAVARGACDDPRRPAGLRILGDVAFTNYLQPSSSVLTASVGWALSHVFVQRATLKRDARYLAQRLGLILEKYAVDCADFIAGNERLKTNREAKKIRFLRLASIL
jgi:hypothetical protein